MSWLRTGKFDRSVQNHFLKTLTPKTFCCVVLIGFSIEAPLKIPSCRGAEGLISLHGAASWGGLGGVHLSIESGIPCVVSQRPPSPFQRGVVSSIVVPTKAAWAASTQSEKPPSKRPIREIFWLPKGERTKAIAIIGVNLIDGKSSSLLKNRTVVVSNGKITAVGSPHTISIPPEAEAFKGSGLTMLPGFMDAHFHLDGDNDLPSLFLSHGVTSVRDPGAWMESYEKVIQKEGFRPRLFLAGPHLDCPPPAYPKDSLIVRDPTEARLAVNRLIDSGATVIKVYFRLPLDLVQTVTETAHARGVPVTAHLEIVDAADALRAGVDGLEHVTSVGTALLSPREAEVYRQSVLADNQARREGRYRVWSEIDLNSKRVQTLLDLMKQKNTTLSPTLAVFERRSGDRGTTEMHVRGFLQMMNFVGVACRAGVRMVVGSHSSVPHAERGWAYQREMELLVESGLTPMQAIQSATIENARFFRVEDRLGSIEVGKQADLLLVEGDPSQDISSTRRVKRVMIEGAWVH
jgi:imidazolonepropionase-like amidohydrolase